MKKKFSVAVGSDAYRDNWDKVFGKVVVESSFDLRRARCTQCGAYIREDASSEEIPHGEGCTVTTPLRRPQPGEKK